MALDDFRVSGGGETVDQELMNNIGVDLRIESVAVNNVVLLIQQSDSPWSGR